MPGDEEGKMYFSFNRGPIHFVMISTEHYFTKEGHTEIRLSDVAKQYEWIESDLEAS